MNQGELHIIYKFTRDIIFQMLNFYLFFRIDIRILVLVRDPRATMHSRLELEFTLEALYFFTLLFFEMQIHSPLAKITFFQVQGI